MDEIEVSEKQITTDSQAFRDAMAAAKKVLDASPDNRQERDIDELCPLKEWFADGIYMREIFMPKGTIIMGKIHKYEHPNFVMQGEVVSQTPEGEKVIKAPCFFISKPGTQRLLLIKEDTIWITAHKNFDNLKDRDLLEEFHVVRTFEEYDQFKQLETSPKKELVNL